MSFEILRSSNQLETSPFLQGNIDHSGICCFEKPCSAFTGIYTGGSVLWKIFAYTWSLPGFLTGLFASFLDC